MNSTTTYCRTMLISLTLLLILGSSALADESTHFELHVQAGDELLAQVRTLPIFKVYNSEGQQVFFKEGMTKQFRQRLAEVITSPQMGDTELTLATELALLVQDDGATVAAEALPEADFTFVKYWANWCAPCHKQSKTVKELVAAHPEVKINVIHVEADATK